MASRTAPSLSGQLRSRKSSARLTRPGRRWTGWDLRLRPARRWSWSAIVPVGDVPVGRFPRRPRYARPAAARCLRDGAAQSLGSFRQARIWQLVVLEQIDERLREPRLIEVADDAAALDEADLAGLLADDDDDRVRLLGDAERGPVARSEPPRICPCLRQRQCHARSYDAVIAHDHGAVVQRRVRREESSPAVRRSARRRCERPSRPCPSVRYRAR